MLVSVAVLPLVLPPAAFPFIFSKAMLFRIIVELSLAVFLISLAVFFRRGEWTDILHRIKYFIKNKIFILSSVFIFIVFLSSVFAIDPFRAFWGNAERMEGFFGLLHYFIFFILSAFLFEKKDWLSFFKLSLLTGFVLFVFGLFQFAGIKTFALIPVSDRPGSFLGNPDFLGTQFIFLSAFSAIIFFEAKKYSFWGFFSGLMFCISLAGIFLSGTRGAILGIFSGLLFSLVYLCLNKEVALAVRKSAMILFGLLAISVAIFGLTHKNQIWQKIPGLNRLAGISLSDQTTKTRLISLHIAYDSIREHPILGWGQDNYGIAFSKNFSPEYLFYEEAWFDRAHNKLSDVAVMNGLFGLVFYLGIFVASFASIRKIRAISQKIILYSLFVSCFIQNLFTFDQVNSYILFFAALAFVIYLSDQTEISNIAKNQDRSKQAPALPSFAIIILVVVILFSLIKYNYVPYRQMKIYVSAVESGKIEAVQEKSAKFLKPYTFIQDSMRYSFLQVLWSNDLIKNQDDLSKTAISAYEEVVEKNKYDIQSRINLIQFYGDIADDQEVLEKTESIGREMVALSPNHPISYYFLASALAREGKKDEAVSVIGRAVNLNPNLGKVYYYRGVILSMLGEREDAKANIIKAIQLGMREISDIDQNNIKNILGDDFEKIMKGSNINK